MPSDIEAQNIENKKKSHLVAFSIIVCIICPCIGIFIFADLIEFINDNPNDETPPNSIVLNVTLYLALQFTLCVLLCLSSLIYCLNNNLQNYPADNSDRRRNQPYQAGRLDSSQVRRTPSPNINPDYQVQINLENTEQELCISCWENARSVKLNCGHTGLCHTCAHKIKHKLKVCPICRAEITNIKEEIFSDKDYSPSISNSSQDSDEV